MLRLLLFLQLEDFQSLIYCRQPTLILLQFSNSDPSDASVAVPADSTKVQDSASFISGTVKYRHLSDASRAAIALLQPVTILDLQFFSWICYRPPALLQFQHPIYVSVHTSIASIERCNCFSICCISSVVANKVEAYYLLQLLQTILSALVPCSLKVSNSGDL